tara:strand:+ start:19 stop:408 length:390 start_codon:yes stop_codon:yes gene_type:complete
MMASGKTISDADRRRAKKMLDESGRTISDADRRRALKALREMQEDAPTERMEELEEMAPGMRDGGMTDQMAEQMYMSEREAGGLMKKAKRINDADMMNMADGGMARIKGTPPAQVKGFTYNDNGGKGTF